MTTPSGESGEGLERLVWNAVHDGLTDAGDGSYVTSFDTEEDAETVAQAVTLRVLDALGLEQVGLWEPKERELHYVEERNDDCDIWGCEPVYRLRHPASSNAEGSCVAPPAEGPTNEGGPAPMADPRETGALRDWLELEAERHLNRERFDPRFCDGFEAAVGWVLDNLGLEQVGWQAKDGEVMGLPHPAALHHFDLTGCERVYVARPSARQDGAT